MEPNKKCWTICRLANNSAQYILIIPSLIFCQDATPLISNYIGDVS